MMGDTGRELAFLAVDKNKVDIGTVIELAPTEFAKCQNSKVSSGRTGTFPELRVPVSEDFTDTDFSELR